jgi:chromosome partitioning protein
LRNRLTDYLRNCLRKVNMPGMIVTVTSHKGGVGKTVTAVHLAAYLAQLGSHGGEHDSTLLVDADPNRSAIRWASRGRLPFTVVAEPQAAKYAREHEHIVIDTQGRPGKADLEALADGCDLLVIPSTPDALSLDALMLTVEELEELGRSDGYKVLLTVVPPWPVRSGKKARVSLEKLGVPLFRGEIRRREAFQKAANLGVPVYEVKDRRAAQSWEDYLRIGEEVVRGS